MPSCLVSSVCLVLTAIAVSTSSVTAQVPELKYTTDLALDVNKEAIRRYSPVVFNPRTNEIVILGFGGVVAFDSVGTKKKWNVLVSGGRRTGDIGSIDRTGWMGDSLWIADAFFRQLVVLDRDGKILRSLEPFTWVRPQWSDRRRYPLFAEMSWHALYPDGSALIVPRSRRVIFETPEFDRSKTHLVRVDRDGKILKTIARVPSAEGRLTLHTGMDRTAIGLPFFAKPFFDVSADGRRIAVLEPLRSASDSGAFMLTTLNADGDTLFTKRFVVTAKRVPMDAVEKALAAIKPFGRYTAEWIRDTVRTQIPVFESRVIGMSTGDDNSLWVWLQTDEPGRRALVIDSTGVTAGTLLIPVASNVATLGIDRMWMWQREGPYNRPTKMSLVRLARVPATGARPARSATDAASPRR